MHVKKDAPSDNLAQTWLVRPSSQAFLNTLRKKQGESVHSSVNTSDVAVVTPKDYSGTADSPAARTRSSRRSVLDLGRPGSHFMKGKIVNKSSFTKPTFKWMRGELIGKGSYGRVYLALNATTGEVMAVKQVELPRIAKDLRHSEQLDVVRALRSESDTLRDLDHPNIVQYLGYEENADCLSIFLEYVPGGTIASCLRKYGKFDENISKSFTAQILNGLEYLHSKQILHRDLKSDNILVEINGACKISDFGISKKAEGRAFTGMKGTVYWMAPEVLDSEGKGYDAKVDIWSIGCILQEMWTGKRPWCGEELVAVMMKLVFDKKPPPLPSGMKHNLPPNALDFLELCFQSDPTRRPSAALLKKHPYLALPANWVFPAFDEARYTFSLTRLNSMRNPGVEGENIESGRNHNEYDVPTARPNQKTYPARSNIRGTLHFQTVKRGPSPPLVIITPPGSPKKSTAPTDWVLGKQSPYTASESSESRSRTSRSSRSRRKTYRITNPDCDSDNEEGHRNNDYRPLFTYNPPPLPELGPPVPYSSALDAPSTLTSSTSQHSLNSYLERIGRRRTVRLSRSRADTPKSRLAYNAKEFEDLPESTGNSDSDPETTTGGSMWKKPPADLVPVRYKEPRSPVEDRLSRLTARLSLSDRHGESWAPRPDIEDVVQHLEEFFPDHNLDQEIGEGGSRIPGLSLARTGVARGKSIRKMAEEQVNRQQTDPKVLRRRTQLWDSRLQELK